MTASDERRADWGANHSQSNIVALAIIGAVAAIGPGSLALAAGFDGLYGQDPYAYFDYAMGPLREGIGRLSLPPFYWPPGYPLAMLAAATAVGASPLAGQIVSLLSAAAAAIFTGLMTRALLELSSDGADHTRHARAAWMSAGLVALTPQLWQSAMVVMADAIALALATIAMWSALRGVQRRSMQWIVLSASALAFAMLCRWVYALIAPIWLLLLTLNVRSAPTMTEPEARRLPVLIRAVVGLGVVAIWLSPVLVQSALGRSSPVESAPAAFLGQTQVYSWTPLNMLRRTFETVEGRFEYRLPNGAYYLAAPARLYFFTPFIAPFIAVGAWRLWRRRALAPLAMLGAWAFVVFAFHAGAHWQNFRYTLAFLPPFAALAGLGIVDAARLSSGAARRGVIVVVLVGVSIMGAQGVALCRWFIERKEADLAAARWAAAETPAGALLLSFGITLTLQHYTHVDARDLYYATDADLQRLHASERAIYVLVDPDAMATQWRDRSPGVNFRWLRDGPGLTDVGQVGALTLFRVNR